VDRETPSPPLWEKRVSERAKIRLTLSPQAERYVRQDAPVDVRRMAAGGALPLPPIELATVLFALVHDPDEEVKARATESLATLPESMRATVLGGPAHPAVLGYLAHVVKDDAEACETLALNPRSDDGTIAFLATLPHRRVVDVVSHNQERMLREPEIVEALGANPLTSRATIDRILNFLGLERPEAEAASDLALDTPPQEGTLSDVDAEATLRAILGNDTGGLAEELVQDREEEAKEPDPDPEDANTNLYALVQGLSVFQKIKLARMGNKEARSLLVRDRNKIVATAAIRSPKITDNEVVAFAKARSVCDEVLRAIAANRDWTRNYQVKLGLSTNPKCPQATAIKFLNYLQERDLRVIMKSRDVPTAVATHARRILAKKGKV
jgi:hypothetical protein